MTRAVRLCIFTPVAAMVGLCLNFAAVMVVAAGSGSPGVPSPFLELVYLACWPSALVGIPHEDYFYANALRNILINILGWTSLGVLASLVPARRARK
jgi:hypothetical protein